MDIYQLAAAVLGWAIGAGLAIYLIEKFDR